jgi:hypothetical protein
MTFDKKGSGTIVIIFVIVVLALIAYGIGKKNTAMAPTIEDTPGQIPSSDGTTSPSSGSGSSGTTVGGDTPTENQESTETTEFTELEVEAESMTQDFDDLMFEDLGFE